jgi:hypothetical protein
MPWLGALSGLAVGCSGAADIPNTPDLSALRARYEAPSAEIDMEAAEEVLTEVPALDKLAAAFRSLRVAADGVDNASGGGHKATSNIKVQGGIHVTVRCPGQGDTPVYDAATNGTVSLTIAVAENSIRRDVGGEASHCLARATIPVVNIPLMIGFNGPIAFDLGHDISLGDRWSGELLMSLGGRLDIEELAFDALTARFDDNRFEYLFQRRDGSTVVLSLSPDGVRLRDRTGFWFCSDPKSCAHE